MDWNNWKLEILHLIYSITGAFSSKILFCYFWQIHFSQKLCERSARFLTWYDEIPRKLERVRHSYTIFKQERYLRTHSFSGTDICHQKLSGTLSKFLISYQKFDRANKLDNKLSQWQNNTTENSSTSYFNSLQYLNTYF